VLNKQIQELRLKETYLEVINSFAVILVNAKTIDDIVWGVTKNAIAALNYLDCIIYLYDENEDMLIQRAAHGPKNIKDQSVLAPIKIAPGKGIVGEVFLNGIGENIADTSKDKRYITDDQKRLSEITIPIISNGVVLGVIDSEHPDSDFFNEQDFKMLTTVAAMVSVKLEQARANEDLQKYQQNLERIVSEQTAKLEQANKELRAQNSELKKQQLN
jgi:putative methionine-R-sulfoxide reductase with GAF domain